MNWTQWVGLPWADRGRGPDAFDCWGLLVAAFEAGTGIVLPSHAEGYQSADDGAEVAALMAGEVGDWVRVERSEAQAFYGVAMVLGGGLHVGLIVRPGQMLHVRKGRLSAIEPLARFRAVEIYRHKRMVEP